MSSHHKPDIEKWVLPLKECTADLNIERDAKDKISHAIKSYIYIKINALFTSYGSAYGIQDPDIQDPDILVELQKVDDVAKELHTRADNTFLWVSLPFEQIEASKCDANNVSEFVRRMPVGLYEMYNQMMREILKQENNYPDYCKTVLLAAVNPYRPLQFTKWKTKKKIAKLPTLAMPRRVIQLCGLLSLGEDQVVYFIHQSAKDYFIQNAESEFLSEFCPQWTSGRASSNTTTIPFLHVKGSEKEYLCFGVSWIPNFRCQT